MCFTVPQPLTDAKPSEASKNELGLKMKHNFKIELGAPARDKITGFEGIVVSRTQWLNACNVYGVQPSSLNKDGGLRDKEHFDEPQLEVTGTSTIKPKRETGGPAHAAVQANR